jgi:hypothetical protein
VVADEDAFAEDLVFQAGAGGVIDEPGEPVLGGGVAGEGPGDDPFGPGVGDNAGDLGLDTGSGAAGAAPGEGVGKYGELGLGLGQGLVQALGLSIVECW